MYYLKPERKVLPDERFERGYEGKDDKLHYLTPHLSNLTLYFGIYPAIYELIFRLCRSAIKPRSMNCL